MSFDFFKHLNDARLSTELKVMGPVGTVTNLCMLESWKHYAELVATITQSS